MQKTFIYILLTFLIFIYSCTNEKLSNCLERPGEIDSLEFFIEPFYEVNLYDNFDVYLVEDTINKIKIKGNKNLIDNIEFEIKDSILSISENSICDFIRSYDVVREVYIHSENINYIYVFGSNKIFSEDTLNFENFLIRVYSKISYVDVKVNCDHFFLEQWQATGDYFVEGNTVFFHVLNHGNSYIYSNKLNSDYTTVYQKSTGDIYISVNKSLSTYIYDIGNIYYSGNPEKIIIEEKTSTGELIKVDN